MEAEVKKREKLERVTIYLTRKEKRDAQIAAAHAELNMATLGRKAIQYLIYAPEEVPNVELDKESIREAATESITRFSSGTD